MAAALRFLLRRRAVAPSALSVALLQPLFPRPYSKLSAPPVPSLLRRTSGEGCSALLPRKPTDRGREATQRPIQPSSPLLAIPAASNFLGMQRVQIQHPSPPQVPSLIRHYSSKGCACTLPLTQQPIDPQTCQRLKQAQSLLEAVTNLAEQGKLVLKGSETCLEACDLLDAGVDDDKVFAMFEKGLDDTSNALAVYEKDLDVLTKALGSTKGMQLDIDLEPKWMMCLVKKKKWMMCKRTKNFLESMRQDLKELQRSHETKRTLEKICKRLEFANIVVGALVLLMLLLIANLA